MSPAIFKKLRVVFGALLFVTAIGFGQDRGTIRGVISDATAAPVPGAVVTATNVNTGLTQTTATTAEGLYNIPYLPVGEYTVTTEKPGFRRAEAAHIIVNVNSVLDIDMKLAVGAIDQKIAVVDLAPLL